MKPWILFLIGCLYGCVSVSKPIQPIVASHGILIKNVTVVGTHSGTLSLPIYYLHDNKEVDEIIRMAEQRGAYIRRVAGTD